MTYLITLLAGGVLATIVLSAYLACEKPDWRICISCHAHYLKKLSDSQMPDLFCTSHCEGKELAKMDQFETVWRGDAEIGKYQRTGNGTVQGTGRN